MSRRRRLFVILALFGCGVTVPPSAVAQTARGPREGEVESDPIRCWWKTEKTAIRVGERFKLVLTCGVIEARSVTVVPAVNQLEPGAISLTPFEAVSGTRREDVVVPPWRYLQYEYTMRLLNEGFFGQDVNIPSLTVTYNLQSSGGGVEGRDQTYVLPPLPMRVLSVVPRTVNDIRDASAQTFEAVETRRFRATLATVAAGIAFAFALVLAGLAVARAAGRFRTRDREALRPVPASSALRACLRALAQVRSEAGGEGWTPELRGRALAALRVAAALALGRNVAQQYVDGSVRERAGQLLVPMGMLRRKRALVSAATTPVAIASSLSGPAVRSAQVRLALEQISEALQVFGAATYGRNGEPDPLTLNNALDNAVAAIKRLRMKALWSAVGIRPSLFGVGTSTTDFQGLKAATGDRRP